MRAAVLLIALLLAGCAQPRKMDWQAMLDEAGVPKQVRVR
jgi:outer membrane murein-binding lipoprotein Lpp